MIKIDIKTPKTDDIEIPFDCPVCEQTIKIKSGDLKKLKECPSCKKPIFWK